MYFDRAECNAFATQTQRLKFKLFARKRTRVIKQMFAHQQPIYFVPY